MHQLVYNPTKSGKRMSIVCFVSGSGTNYREIVTYNPKHNYVLFTNRPGCGGTAIAKHFGHKVIELSHIPFLEEARQKYGTQRVPRNCPERVWYERDAIRLIEREFGRLPDLICLAGYDQWTTDWLVDKFYPRILNVHPGDTSKGYNGLHWIPSAKALLAGDQELRSTVFFVDKGEDSGPVLLQSAPLNIVSVLKRLEVGGEKGLLEVLQKITDFAKTNNISTYVDFAAKAGPELCSELERICRKLQDELKVFGDWKIYPHAVHDLIARGRVAIENRRVIIDGTPVPEFGMRLE